ncbi:hypothetical protein BH23BAC2_BH23BAC2_05430 [soil metagenome]
MRDLDLNLLENELKKRWEIPYAWGRKQNDLWDSHSQFIYKVETWEELLQKIDEVAHQKELDGFQFRNYACNRWYNFKSAMAVEKIFCDQVGVKASLSRTNRLIDFNLRGVDFDHKTSVFPQNFPGGLDDARRNLPALVEWLYKNQSTQQRQHFGNRLFLVVFDHKGEHWKLKAELSFLKNIITSYVQTFNSANLVKLHLLTGNTTYSDIIWAVK